MVIEDLKRAEKRFWLHVTILGPDDCWPWMSSTHKFGHGYFNVSPKAKNHYAHRVAKMLDLGKVLDKSETVRHSCDNPPCCNPKHLIVGTKKQNTEDMLSRGRCSAGNKHYNSKITNEQSDWARKVYSKKEMTQQQIGKVLGISQSAVSRILSNKRYKKVLR